MRNSPIYLRGRRQLQIDLLHRQRKKKLMDQGDEIIGIMAE
jgi:hypothetical protein